MLDAIDNRTELRLQLLRQGYTPLPNVDKICKLPAWNTVAVDEAFVRRLGRSRQPWFSTGLRLDNGLVAIDADVLDASLADQAWKLVPKGSLKRVGRAPKWMAVARLEDISGAGVAKRLHSGSWTDGTNKHCIEIFTREWQIGAFGWHTAGERKYQWLGKSPAEVPLDRLPRVPARRLYEIVAAFDELAKAAGLTQLQDAHGSATTRFYDLDEHTRFKDNEGRTGVTLAELEQNYFAAAHAGRHYAVSSSYRGDDGRRMDKCSVGWSKASDCVCVFDFEQYAVHLPLAAAVGSGASMISEELANMLNILTGGENS